MPDFVTLNVRGEATTEVAADFADLHVSVQARRASRSKAISDVDTLLRGLADALGEGGDIRSSTVSQPSVQQATRWDDKSQQQVDDGWLAQAHGSAKVSSEFVNVVMQRLLAAEVQIDYARWDVDPDNSAIRDMRAKAVADARRAAEDFAAALGRELGPLVVLSDPGLLGAASGRGIEAGPLPMLAKAASGAGPQIELDPALITVSASVEATFRTA